MKKLFLLFLIIICLHCEMFNEKISLSKDGEGNLWFKNSEIQLKINSTMGMKIFYKKGTELLSLTKDRTNNPGILPSHFIVTDEVEIKDFVIINVNLSAIDTKYGKGKRLVCLGINDESKIEKKMVLDMYYDYPDVLITKASYRNIGEEQIMIDKIFSNYFVIAEALVNNTENRNGFWTFQGAAYKWGQDFAFKLPKGFSRENYFGMNDDLVGGGLPIIDIWCNKCGIAVGHIESKPTPVYMPVREKNDRSVEIGIYEKVEKILKPNETYDTINTILIVHSLDFFNALNQYGKIMKKNLPKLPPPPDFAYKTEWCSWGFRRDFTVEDIYDLIPTLKKFGFKSIIIDDGWFPCKGNVPLVGDWYPVKDKFPNGEEDIKEFVKNLHDEDFNVWLWWSPFSAHKESEIAQMHPDWLIMKENGDIHPAYDLCPAYGPVIEHHRKLVEKFVGEWNFDGLKIDFARINAAPPCYNPKHNHKSPWNSYELLPELYKTIYETASSIKPDFLIEYCPCSVPPSIYHFPWFNLPVVSDPRIDQITRRIKMYKALMSPNTPVIMEECAILSKPSYELTIGAGGVPGTYTRILDGYNEKWLRIYREHMLSKGKYLNLYDIAFDFPEAHIIESNNSLYYAFYTTPTLDVQKSRIWRFSNQYDKVIDKSVSESILNIRKYKGKIELRGLDKSKKYEIIDYTNNKSYGFIKGSDPFLSVVIDTYLLLRAIER